MRGAYPLGTPIRDTVCLEEFWRNLDDLEKCWRNLLKKNMVPDKKNRSSQV